MKVYTAYIREMRIDVSGNYQVDQEPFTCSDNAASWCDDIFEELLLFFNVVVFYTCITLKGNATNFKNSYIILVPQDRSVNI